LKRVCLLLLFAVLHIRAADRWERIGTPDFEIYSNAGDAAARKVLTQLQQVRGFFLKASPLPLLDIFPARIVVFKTLDQFRQYAQSESQRAFFAASAQRDYIVMADSPNEYAYAIHEYMHLIVRHSGLHLPSWLNEGWSEVYSTLRPVADGVAVGDLIEGRMRTLSSAEWLDLATLTSVTPQSPLYKGSGADVFYAESWALAHMLFLAPDYSPDFARFLLAIHLGKTFDEACSLAYRKTSAEVYTDLRGYFDRKKMYGRVFHAPLAKSGAPRESIRLTDFDERLLLADLLAATNRRPEARAEYDRLAAQFADRYEVAESLGYLALSANDRNTARQNFTRAFDAGDADPRMCLRLALLDREAKQPLTRLASELERALNSSPAYVDALLQLGIVRIAQRDYQAGIAALLKIDQIQPDQAPAVFSALSYAYFEQGDLERARKHAETARQYVRTQAETARIDSLVETIEARAKGRFPPHPGEKTERVEGVLRQIDCKPAGNLMAVEVAGSIMTFDLPEPKAVEFIHDAGPALQVACGPQRPIRLIIEYIPASVLRLETAGVVRRIEY
jgi:Flp pilus assembly protein TadD